MPRPKTDPRPNRARARREAIGLSQVALAEAAGVSRQSIGAIESGRAVPGVDVALRIARALQTRVEALFGADDDGALVTAEPAGASLGGRVTVARIGGRWVAHDLGRHGLGLSADGVTRERRRDGVEVELLRDPADNLVVMGCAPALGLLADRLNSGRGPGRFVWLPRSSTAALEALAAQRTHLAGAHLVDALSGEANVDAVRRIARPTQTVALITLARWEAGLVLRRADRERLRSAADLARPGLRLALREPGAGARDLLERTLRSADVDIAQVIPSVEVPGHLELAAAVAMGAADTGVATRDAAMAFGLEFVPLAEERYDLVLPGALIDDPRVERLLDALVSRPFRRELAALGYDVAPTGERIAEVRAA